MNDKPILIVGGTGKTGWRVADRLQSKGAAVRIGSRTATPAFDWDKPATWLPTLEGAFLREIPLGRLVTVNDIANAALWLASDEAFITGQVIDITGGQSLRRVPTNEEMMR